MGIFQNPTPLAPSPKSPFNAIREADTINSLRETKRVVDRLVRLLDRYQPTQITDAAGFRKEVLAIDLGKTPVQTYCWLSDTEYGNDAPEALRNTHAVWLGRGTADFVEDPGCTVSKLEVDVQGPDSLFRLLSGSESSGDTDGIIISSDLGESGYTHNLAYTESLLSMYDADQSSYIGITTAPDNTNAENATIYGYAESQIYNFRMTADTGKQVSAMTVWGSDSNVYADLRTEVNKSTLFGYSNNEAWNYLLRADATTSSSYLRLFNKESTGFSQVLVSETNGGELWLYGESQKHNLKYVKGLMQVWGKVDGGNDCYIDLSIPMMEAIKTAYTNALLHIAPRVLSICNSSKKKQHIIALCTLPFDPNST